MPHLNHISYLHNSSLDSLSGWAEKVAAATQHEPHLLPQLVAAINSAGHEDRLIVATDRHTFIGSIALWPLGVVTEGVQWFELGTVFVTPEYRFPQSGLDIADELHRRIMTLANGHDIMATTTNPSERKSWQRVGFITVPFAKLPPEVLLATCVCPTNKTGVTNPLDCPYRGKSCTVALAPDTLARLKVA